MKLLPLTCPNCSHWLDAADRDRVVTCPNCRRLVGLAQTGLTVVDVPFARPVRIEPDKVGDWRPFWVFDGQVQIQRRASQSGNRDAEAQSLWGQRRRFYVPAWDLSIDHLRRLGTHLIQSQPALTRLENVPESATLTPATIAEEDAAKLIEFIVLDIEARRADVLRDLQFNLSLDPPAFWALPMPGGTIHV